MKRQYLFLALLASTLSLQASDLAFAGMDNQIACSPDMAQYQCNTCFDGGFLYEGKEKTSLYDIAKNTGTLRNVYFADENGNDAIQIKNRGGSGVVFTTPIFDYHSDFFTLNRIKFPGVSTWAPMMHPDGSVKWGTIMDPGSAYKWAETLPGKELYVTSVNKSTVTDANRSMIRDKNFVVVYSLKTQFRNTTTRTWEGSNTHVECQQIGIHFCGDGLVESAYGEQCDDGGQNGQPGKCNTSCTGTVPPTPTPSCDSITAVPTFGSSPFTTTLTCDGSHLPTGATYAIECGNGTNATMNGNKGTCTYTNTSTTNSATYGAKCIINNTITSQACQMNIGVNPTPAPPVCNPLKTGTQTAPVLSTDPLCTTGTPSGFIPSGTNPIQYAWTCNNAAQSVNCAASYTPSNTGSGAFDLSIKKYIDTNDAQPGSPVYIQTASGFNYIIRVKNEGTGSAIGTTTVKDILPAGVYATANPSGFGWSCNIIGQSITCLFGEKNDAIRTGAYFPDIIIPARLSSIVSGEAIAGSIQNNAVVYNPNEALPCYADNRMPTGNESVCTHDPKNTDPAVIRVGVAPTGFDLSLKKYIGTGSVDAQPGAAVSVNTGDRINYLIRVTNSGPQSSSGITTVQDILPVGVTASGSVSGAGWTCSYSGAMLTCTSTQIVGSGSTYPDITVPVIVTATAGQSVTNIAAVDNPNETNRCNTDGSMPANAGTSCNRDPNNSDPAVISVPGGGGGGGGGGASHVGKVCVNGVISCVFYNSIVACTQAGIPLDKCYSADAPGQAMCAAQSLTCGGGGGGGYTPGTGTAGRCGDGVLGSSAGEECDVVGAPWCGKPGTANACKVIGMTNPGANPITSMWMRIPALAGTSRHLGQSFIKKDLYLDGTIADGYKIVVGKESNVFTLSDEVIFGVTTRYTIPVMIPANKTMCLQASGNSVNSPNAICTTFGAAAPTTSINGTNYVVLGAGTYQKRLSDGTYTGVTITSPVHEALLFKGSTQYQTLIGNAGPTLRDAFQGKGGPSDMGTISLFGCNGSDCSASAITTMIQIPVRVSSTMVSSIGSSSNRALESFLNPANPFVGFLGTTSMNTSTTNSNNSQNTSIVNLPTIVGTTGNQSSSGVADLERFSVNGNRNILSISGSLTIENCPNNTFEMKGVRTVIVTGDLIIKCNIGYSTNNDASWAWIAKNGNIKVYNGTGTPNVGAVTNLAGVFVAVKDSVGGDITYTGSNTTQAILRIDGSLYGNATPLFNSRLYGRATGAYDILTTGTVISYSNRALVSPPPLLSQYLGAYSVQRVVQ